MASAAGPASSVSAGTEAGKAALPSYWDSVSYADSRKDMYEYADAFCEDLSKKEKQTIHEYTEETPHTEWGHTMPIYRNINEVNRGVPGATFEKGNKKRSKRLHETLTECRTPEGIVVYRCIDTSKMGGIYQMSDEEIVGKNIWEKGFVSTCHADGVADIPPSLINGRDTVLEIYVPKGSRGVNIEQLSHFHHWEKEVLLDQMQIFKIDSVRYEMGKRILRVISLL